MGAQETRRLQFAFDLSCVAKCELLSQKLVELQTAPFGGSSFAVSLIVSARRRVVQTFECVAKRRQRKGLCEARGDDVGEINVKHGPVNAFSQPSLGDMFAGRIDGGERRGKLGRVRNRIFDFGCSI